MIIEGIAAVLLCLFTLFYVVKLNKERGVPLKKWDWIDWLRILVSLYWIFVSAKLALGFSIGPNGHELIYPGVILTLALVAGSSIRKEKRVCGNGTH